MRTPILNHQLLAMPGNVPGRLAIHPSRFLLIGTILLAGLVSIPQMITFGSVSGLGAASAVVCGLALLFWLRRPMFAQLHLPVLLPLLMFGIYAAGSLMWFSPTTKGLQVLCVLLAFVAVTLLCAREVENDPAFASLLHRTADAATLFAVCVYGLSVPLFGMENNELMMPRPFALFALVGVARQVAVWQSGNWKGLLRAGLIIVIIYLSVSRTAMVAGMLMIPFAALIRGDKKGIFYSLAAGVVGAVALGLGIMLSPKMQERFFGLDASMNVGGVAVNASGRTAMWEMLWNDAFKTPILGRGVGSSSLLIDDFFPGLGHPHNDFLRFFYDFGVIGLGLWLVFHIVATITVFVRARRAARVKSADLEIHLVPMMLLVVLVPAMLTDNPVGYYFVMVPLAVMLGCSLGVHSARMNERNDDKHSSRKPTFVGQLAPQQQPRPPAATPTTMARRARVTR